MSSHRQVKSAGRTDRGRREHNEDRCHEDAARGIFIVVDGVGGQAAGGEAAEVALKMLRSRLERETAPGGPREDERIREAIVAANNEVYRVGCSRREYEGMACVLTVAVLENEHVVIGHVGDTRLYKLHAGRLQKLTKDHSPVGEREDAGELTEVEAMQHPRRNEVFRDVGSELHSASDPNFIDIYRAPFERDAALLLCSDGLTDMVDAATIQHTIEDHAGSPHDAVVGLIAHANAAGGKDNITAIVVEGEMFVARRTAGSDTEELETRELAPRTPTTAVQSARPSGRRWWLSAQTIAGVLAGVTIAALSIFALDKYFEPPPPDPPDRQAAPATISVNTGESIAAALQRAVAGTEVVVQPGQYNEAIEIGAGVRLVSLVPRGATITPPPGTAVAILARDAPGAEIVGFRIAGNNSTATGLQIVGGAISVYDIEVTGTTQAAIDLGSLEQTNISGCQVHDNAGAALAFRRQSQSRVANCTFTKNGGALIKQILVEDASTAQLQRNTFYSPLSAIVELFPESVRAVITRDNAFITPPAAPRAGRGRQ
jgi:serine/threonine protein phosphatase PrpC